MGRVNRPTEILQANSAAIARAAHVLRIGGLVAFPTETVYGLGADAMNGEAVRGIFDAKGRPSNNPVIVHIADTPQAATVVDDWPELAHRLAARFWPGPLTIVLPKRPHVPDEVTAGLPSVGIRMPNHPVALALLREAGRPIAAPSANRSTEISPTTAQHVWKSLDGLVDMILDGGPCPGGIESTVLDLTVHPPRILRPGLITATDLEPFIGKVEETTAIPTTQPLPSPGMMERHYSPRTPLELAAGDGNARVLELMANGLRIGWLTWATARTVSGPNRIDMPKSPADYAANLYAALHEADTWSVDRIVVAEPPHGADWTAVRDRLTRAAQPRL